MNNNDKYEIKAEAFRIMTGHMAPGKDPASVSCPALVEERFEIFEKWLNENGDCVNAMIKAFGNIMDLDAEE